MRASASFTAFITADSAPTVPDSPAPLTPSGLVLVGNYWTSGGEFAGINGIYDLYRKQYPNVNIVHAGVAGGAGLNFQSLALTKLQGGDPFDVMQMHVAKEALLYDPEQYLTPLEDIVNQTEGDVMPTDTVIACLRRNAGKGLAAAE